MSYLWFLEHLPRELILFIKYSKIGGCSTVEIQGTRRFMDLISL